MLKNRNNILFLVLSFFLVPLVYTQEPNENSQAAENFGTNNNNSTVSSNNNTTATTNTYNGSGSAPGSMPVGSAMAPSLMSNGMESCLMSISGGVQLFTIGATKGKYKQDEECNRRRDAKVLKDLGMSVAAVARMCESLDVFKSMFVSGTPCPILVNGRLVVGRAAYLTMKKNPETYIPDYGKVKSKKKPYMVCKRYKDTKKIISCSDKKEYNIVKVYNKNQVWYNNILGIGEINEENFNNNMSISEQFRSSIKPNS